MKKALLVLFLAVSTCYGQTVIVSSRTEIIPKPNAVLYLVQSKVLRQVVYFDDSVVLGDEVYTSQEKRDVNAERTFSRVLDSFKTVGVIHNSKKMPAAALLAIQKHVPAVRYDHSTSMANYGIIWKLITTSYVCGYDPVEKKVHFSSTVSELYSWKRPLLLVGLASIASFLVAYFFRKRSNVDIFSVSLIFFMLGILFMTTPSLMPHGFLSIQNPLDMILMSGLVWMIVYLIVVFLYRRTKVYKRRR